MFKFNKVTDLSQVQQIAEIAQIVFNEIYTPYTPIDFVADYINTHQSVAAIQKQIEKEDFSYFLLESENEVLGYLGIQTNEHTLHISKLYILKQFRNQQYGKKAMIFINKYASKNNLQEIHLEVSKQNEKAIAFYKKDGFKITDSIIYLHHDNQKIIDYLMVKSTHQL